MSDDLIRRIYRAREAAMSANVDTEELRLNQLAHMRLLDSREHSSKWDVAMSGRKFMGMQVVVERRAISDFALPSEGGEAEIHTEAPTVCVAGRGDRGRWQYFDA